MDNNAPFKSNDEALDPFLQSFFTAELSAPLASGSQERVLSGVLQKLAVPTTSAVAVTSVATITTSKAVAIAIMSAVFGIAIGTAVSRRWPNEVPSQEEPIPRLRHAVLVDAGQRPQTPDATNIVLTVEDASAKRVRVNKTRTLPLKVMAADAGQVTVALPPKSPAAQEAHLIDRARSALRRGLHDGALLALMQHERRFPRGQLAEERDVLIIETYVALGNTRIGTRRIQRYRKQYPKGFHRKRVNHSERQLLEHNQSNAPQSVVK